MPETTFDWRRLDAPPQPSPSAGPTPAVPSRRAMAGATIGIALAVLAAGAYLAATAPDPSVVIEAAATSTGDPVDGPTGGQVVVDVSGAVGRPGVVTLPAGSRVGDAIAAAGGFGPGVDVRAATSLNLAAPLADGAQVVVPERGAGATSGAGTTTLDAQTGGSRPLDLNTASEAELETLPGIGPVTAAKIVAARGEAAFTSVDDLRTRKLVGPTTYERIRDLVRVGG